MADNYLEKRYEEVFRAGARPAAKKSGTPKSIDSLLKRNRSYRGYNTDVVVSEAQLREIVGVNCFVPSSRNRQALRFRLVTKETGADKVLPHIKLGGALPQLHLPFPGTQPEAFIVVCSTDDPDQDIFIDLGISLQSMLLKAVDMGLNGIIIRAFDKAAMAADLELPMQPLAVLAIGRGAESIWIKTVEPGSPLKYYRKDGQHYVPKLPAEALII